MMYIQIFLILLLCQVLPSPLVAKLDYSEEPILPIDNIEDALKANHYILQRGLTPSKNIIIVNIKNQSLQLFRDKKLVKTYKASTSKRGYGQIAGSRRTPIGLHKISEKIGFGAKKNAVFKGRKLVGHMPSYAWGKKAGDFIVARVLRLEGLEHGLNKGKDRFGNNVDSNKRTIYIHGSTAKSKIGTPITPGCVFLTQTDVIDLFNQVPIGTQVIITV